MFWDIPVVIVERGRTVRVEAKTRREAMRKFRARDWIECSDADDTITTVTKVGKCERVEG